MMTKNNKAIIWSQIPLWPDIAKGGFDFSTLKNG
jgi:hypothetical protein